MCFKPDKWTEFTPTEEYLKVVERLTTVAKLLKFIQRFKRKKDVKDYWQTPEETLERLTYDCDDSMRFCVDVLVRIMGIEARGFIHDGYDKERWGDEKKGHGVCVFPYQGKLAMFSNLKFKTGFKDYIEVGHHTFPDGVKSYEIRNEQGKIIKKRYKLIGTY